MVEGFTRDFAIVLWLLMFTVYGLPFTDVFTVYCWLIFKGLMNDLCDGRLVNSRCKGSSSETIKVLLAQANVNGAASSRSPCFFLFF